MSTMLIAFQGMTCPKLPTSTQGWGPQPLPALFQLFGHPLELGLAELQLLPIFEGLHQRLAEALLSRQFLADSQVTKLGRWFS